MKKQIYIRFVVFATACLLAPLILISMLNRSDVWCMSTDNYIYGLIAIFLVLFVLILIVAGKISKRLTERIVGSVEKIDLESKNFTEYQELAHYTVELYNKGDALAAKIEELKNRTDSIRTITDNMQEGLILLDEAGLVLTANQSAAEIFGEQIEGVNIRHIYRETEFQEAITKCLSGKNSEIQIEHEGKHYAMYFSTVHSSSVIGNHTNSQSVVSGGVVLFHDVTEQFKAETQRREFSANVSHELNTPLTTISALAEMIASGMAKSDDIEGFAKRIKDQSGRLLTLIKDIIKLSEFDEEAVEREKTKFNIKKLTQAVIESFKENANNVSFELIGDNFKINANYRMIDELLFNLIDNGVKYNKPNGKVTISLGLQPENMCKISIADTGIGIPKQHQGRVFERFYRADKSRSRKTGGTGLGLSIVKHIAEHHKGSVELISDGRNGTTVICYIKAS